MSNLRHVSIYYTPMIQRSAAISARKLGYAVQKNKQKNLKLNAGEKKIGKALNSQTSTFIKNEELENSNSSADINATTATAKKRLIHLVSTWRAKIAPPQL